MPVTNDYISKKINEIKRQVVDSSAQSVEFYTYYQVIKVELLKIYNLIDNIPSIEEKFAVKYRLRSELNDIEFFMQLYTSNVWGEKWIEAIDNYIQLGGFSLYQLYDTHLFLSETVKYVITLLELTDSNKNKIFCSRYFAQYSQQTKHQQKVLMGTSAIPESLVSIGWQDIKEHGEKSKFFGNVYYPQCDFNLKQFGYSSTIHSPLKNQIFWYCAMLNQKKFLLVSSINYYSADEIENQEIPVSATMVEVGWLLSNGYSARPYSDGSGFIEFFPPKPRRLNPPALVTKTFGQYGDEAKQDRIFLAEQIRMLQNLSNQPQQPIMSKRRLTST